VILTALILFREINTLNGKMHSILTLRGTRGAVGWGTALQTLRSRIHWNFSFRPGVDSASNRNEYQEYFWGSKGSLTTLFTTFMCRLSWNLGTSTSRDPKGLSRPVRGLLYLAWMLQRVVHAFRAV